jgi:integrase
MFNSVLGSKMERYLELRAPMVSVTVTRHDRKILSSLDQFLVDNDYHETELTEDLLEEWSKGLTGKSKTVKEKLSVVRGFAKYLHTLGYPSFLPPLPRVKSDYIPYIFSDQEIDRIFSAADNLKTDSPDRCSPYLSLKVPMALRILYSCGTRLGETMALQRKDIDFANRTILLRHTKFSKERMIPIDDFLLELLERYCLALGIMYQPDAFLFPGKKDGTHFTTRQMQSWFVKIMKLAGIDQREKQAHERGACLHCFRHLFVLKSMQQMEKAGHSVDMNDLLLPTYLGHDCILDTDKYMRFSGAQISETLDVFETFTTGLIPKVEVPYEEE